MPCAPLARRLLEMISLGMTGHHEGGRHAAPVRQCLVEPHSPMEKRTKSPWHHRLSIARIGFVQTFLVPWLLRRSTFLLELYE